MLDTPTVRTASPEDLPTIHHLAVDAGLFGPDELSGLTEAFESATNGSATGHRWLVAELRGVVGAAAYVAPEPFADRLWNLYFLAVAPAAHGVGLGTLLIHEVEAALRREGAEVARVLIVETSSTAAFEGARGFYARRGFTEEARIRDFYGPGDDKVVYWKSLIER